MLWPGLDITLRDGLPEAVSKAVEQAVGVAVKEAVQGVVVELISNPALQERIQNTIAPAQTANSENKQSLLGRAWAWLGERLQQARKSVKAAALLVADRVRKNWVAVVAGVGVTAYAARKRIVLAVSSDWGWAADVAAAIGSALKRPFTALACCG